MGDRTIFHIDANSAFLSWEAAYRLQQGSTIDLREIPSVVGGDSESRHGIVLAKSTSAKKRGIQTGETLFTAKQKYPELTIVPPHYELYLMCSNAMYEILKEYTPVIQRFSVDECFLDMSHEIGTYHKKDAYSLAVEIKDRIKNELGFTVNVGLGPNKLLAKMGGEIKKPDQAITLYSWEIKEKMWGLPVEELFMVGKATAPKLHKLNIHTIGDLANYDPNLLKNKLKSYGLLIWQYANGIDDSEVRKSNFINMKGIGNSTTTSHDVEDKETAHKYLLALAEMVGMRLRDSENCCRLVAVHLRSGGYVEDPRNFVNYSKQRKLFCPTDSTKKIAESAYQLFDEVWKGEPLRHLGLRVSDLCTNEYFQTSIFDDKDVEKMKAIDKVIDSIRYKYGSRAVVRCVFIHSGISPVIGGAGSESYPIMTSVL